MKLDTKSIVAIVSVLAAVIAIGVQYCNPKPNPDIYPRDTLRSERVIIKVDTMWKDRIIEKPIYVTVYDSDTILRVEKSTDTVELPPDTIDRKFPHLVWGEFFDDHLKLLMKDTSGRIIENTWALDYIRNRSYIFDGYTGVLGRRPRLGNDLSDDFGDGSQLGETLRKMRGFESNAYLLYGFRGNFMIRADASWNYRKLGLYLYTQGSTMAPNLEAGGGLRYRIR